MTPSEFAATLAGATYRNEMTADEEAVAKARGLVVIFGASDDLMEFRGAINDEVDAYNGTTAHLTPDGLLTNECESEECPHFDRLKKQAATVEAIWNDGVSGVAWRYRTEIPHATFTVIEDGEPYCEGIVFALADAARNRT